MFQIKAIVKTANETMVEILEGKDVNTTELHNLMYAAATITKKK
jgi:hypothetical protein